jgi:hypothetical protein
MSQCRDFNFKFFFGGDFHGSKAADSAGTVLRFLNFRAGAGDRLVWRLFLRTAWHFAGKKSQRGGNCRAIQIRRLAGRRCLRKPTGGRCTSCSDPKFPFRRAFPHLFTFWQASDISPTTGFRTLPSRGRSGEESTCILRRSFPGESFKAMTSSRTTSVGYNTVQGCQRDSCSASRVWGFTRGPQPETGADLTLVAHPKEVRCEWLHSGPDDGS